MTRALREFRYSRRQDDIPFLENVKEESFRAGKRKFNATLSTPTPEFELRRADRATRVC